MKIAFGGDCSIVGDAISMDIDNFIDIPEYYSADKRIINLEQCISNRTPISGKTTLYASDSIKKRLSSLNIDCVTLANNHIHDCGQEGVLDTMRFLDEWNVSWVGVGKNEKEAKKMYNITDKLVLLSYCQYGVHYLRNVMKAEKDAPGVNAFSLQNVLDDLNALDDGVEAIVSIHWAAEYVALPPYEIILWAKKILEHSKCCLLYGHHPHIFLGALRHNNKEAYISLGNLMFPNFFIDEQQRLVYPQKEDKYAVVNMQMKVGCLTYKKWQVINRQAIVLLYDTEKKSVVLKCFSEQEDGRPITHVIKGNKEKKALVRFEILSRIYKWPSILYIFACKTCMVFTYLTRKVKRICLYYFCSKKKFIY